MYDCRSTYGDMYESIGIPSGPPVKYHEGIDWVICGGESGPGARPMHPDWARSLRDQCQEADVPYFFKQWGAWWPLREAEGYSVSRDIATENAKKIQAAAGTPPVSGRIAEMRRVGKKRAGRLLDAREWNEYPEVSDA